MSALGYTIIVLIYLVAIGYLGYLGYRKTTTAQDYMVAGRKIHPFIMALSYGATFISTSAIVGFGGAAGVFGMGLLWLTFLNIFVGIFIAFVLFGKRTRKMGHNLDSHTFPELLGERFQSRFIQGFSGLVIFAFMPLYAAAVLIGAAQFLAETFGINYEVALFFFTAIVALYVVMGGMKGVMYTDALQGSLMFIGMALLLYFTYSKLGGITAAHQKLESLSNYAMAAFGKGGHLGWTAMPRFGSDMWWTLVSTIVMGVGVGVVAQPQLVVRFMTVKSNRELNRAVLIGGIFILLMTGVAFVVGSLSNVFFIERYGAIAIKAAGGTDNIIPGFINKFIPSWYGALFMITLLSAAMSTISSQFHVMGTSIGRDIYEKALGKSGEHSMLVNRIGTLFVIIVSALIAYILPKVYDGGEAIIARGTAIFFGLCASTFLPAYLGALYFKKLSRKAVIYGMITGFLASAFWILFVHTSESSVLLICKALFGVDSIAGNTVWSVVDPIVVSLLLSILITTVTGLLTVHEFDDQHIKRCFEGVN